LEKNLKQRFGVEEKSCLSLFIQPPHKFFLRFPQSFFLFRKRKHPYNNAFFSLFFCVDFGDNKL
jgi:hypothetical protein